MADGVANQNFCRNRTCSCVHYDHEQYTSCLTAYLQVRVVADAIYGVALLSLAVLLCSGDIVSAGSWTITCYTVQDALQVSLA